MMSPVTATATAGRIAPAAAAGTRPAAASVAARAPTGIQVLRTQPRRALPVSRRAVAVKASADDDEIAMLTKMLALAEARKNAPKPESNGSAAATGGYSGPAFNIKTFNAISPVGLEKFPAGKYKVSGNSDDLEGGEMAIMLRSHKLQESDVPQTVRCIARCGAGVNNIPVDRMTELGIPVFNTPGANANAVKELVICALLLASRGIVEGNSHVNNVINPEEGRDYSKISVRIEKDKALFGGCEIQGKTLGVIGLGQIGGRVVNSALDLGMNVIGYDPVLSLEAALSLPGDRMERTTDLEELLKKCDYITVHVPYIKGVTHHLINAKNLPMCKPGVNLINFARGEIIDGAAVKQMYDTNRMTGKYVSDFSDPDLMGHPRHLVLPHLGASTEEAEENSAAMAAETIMSFLETGAIKNSVNFPTVDLKHVDDSTGGRLCIVNRNDPGVLGKITTFLGQKGINIVQQVNVSRGDIAYTVIDMGTLPQDPAQLQEDLAGTEGVITSRFIGSVFQDEIGTPGTFYKVSWDAEN